MTALDVAFKEWAIVDSALGAGEQTILIRKGGIHERQGRFEVEHDRFLIYPTRLHQSPDMLKEPWRSQVAKTADSHPAFPDSIESSAIPGPYDSGGGPAPPASAPPLIDIRHFVTVQDIFLAPPEEQMARWDVLHIYSPDLVRARYRYKPDRPLYVLLVRVFRLAAGHTITETPAYAGCRSWVNLTEKADTGGSLVVLDERSFAAARSHVRGAAPWSGHTEVNRG